MFPGSPFVRQRFSLAQRAGLVLCATAFVTLLSIAGSLTPDPRGLGTHQQLGLPPCTIQAWSGLRCPSCGMTTAWSQFARGHWIAAWKSNAGGMLLALWGSIAVPWWLASAWRGRWKWIQPTDWMVLGICLSTLVVMMVDWLARIYL